MEIIHPILLLILCDILQCSGVHRSSSQLLLRQKRNWIIDSFTIDEGYQGPFPYPLGKIDIEKDLVLFKIRGQGVDLEPKNVLEINEYTGQITVLRPVDSEEYSTLKLTFQALDRQNHEIDTQLGIHIQIVDSNDNPPIFRLEKYDISIKESTLQGTAVVTIEATDKDRSEKNNKCSLKIISVTPTPKDLEFYLEQIHEKGIGTISIKGCLDHETAQKYTIIVEAKDNAEKPLSSSCTITINIEDGNNHLPVITQQIGPEKVKEGQSNVLVSRIQVNDEDTRGTPAWRAKYTIQGDTNNNFRVTTDPETNEGLVYVEKPLNYEDGKMKNITITVENEIPYYSCKVERRSTTGLWKVVTKSGSTATRTAVSSVTGTELATGASSHQVIVTVEDVNEPPVFDKPSKEVVVTEYFGVGKYLETFTAKDPDVAKENKFKYTIGHDPAGWITVDPDTGKVTTSKVLDRESEFVKDNIYVVTICAVDDGIPKMTSTATLSIHVRDENDHAPSLVVSTIEMCQSDDHSFANITALDDDDEPYSGPFTFVLLGDVEGKWEIDPVVGYSVNLIKDHTVHSEHHELLLEVSDKQGNTAVHNLSVTVCSCLHSNIPNCHMRKSGAALGVGAVGIFLFGMLLIAGLLLLTLLMSCKKEILEIHGDFFSEQLMKSNTENPGTDCPVATVMQNQSQMQEVSQVKAVTINSMLTSGRQLQSATKYSTACGNLEEYGTFENGIFGQQQVANKNLHWLTNDSANNRSQTNSEFFEYQRKTTMAQPSIRGNFMRMSLRGSNMEMRYLQGQSKNELINEAVHGGSQTNSLISEFQKEDSMSEFICGNFMRMSLGASSNTGMRHLWGQSKHGFMNEPVHGASQTKSLISESQREGSVGQDFTRGSYTRKSLGASSEMGMIHLQQKSKHAKWRGHSLTFLENLLNERIPKMMATLQEPGKELGNYEPHVYAEEGDADHNFDLDAISIADVSFDPEMDLDIKFSTLASICMPSDIATVHNIQTSTLVQGESHELNCQQL